MAKKNSENFDQKKSSTIKLAADGQKSLSATQQQFNHLTHKIESLENELKQENEKLLRILKIQLKEIFPLQKKIANQRIQLAITLEKTAEIHRFSKNQSEKIRQTILTLCTDAFEDIDPTPEQKAFYNKWADIPFRNKIIHFRQSTDQMNFAQKVDLNTDQPNIETQEWDEDFQEKRRKHYEETRPHKRKKSKKKMADEAAQNAESAFQNKSIRNIYIALAKILHPDTEVDRVLKVGKEEIMKNVTVAYLEKDLSTLLKLEKEWVHQTAEHFDKLTEDKLKTYISVLEQQASELEFEKKNLYNQPQFQSVSEYGRFSEKLAIHEIREHISAYKQISEHLNLYLKAFKNPNSKNAITAFTNYYCKDYEPDNNSEDWE